MKLLPDGASAPDTPKPSGVFFRWSMTKLHWSLAHASHKCPYSWLKMAGWHRKCSPRKMVDIYIWYTYMWYIYIYIMVDLTPRKKWPSKFRGIYSIFSQTHSQNFGVCTLFSEKPTAEVKGAIAMKGCYRHFTGFESIFFCIVKQRNRMYCTAIISC
jgi:hypothetical protein